jgi:hypothetical protein
MSMSILPPMVDTTTFDIRSDFRRPFGIARLSWIRFRERYVGERYMQDL